MRVGDFGLSRDVYAHLYYRADKHSKIPVKWSAPEMLNDGLCTEKSDVVGWHFLHDNQNRLCFITDMPSLNTGV